MLGNVPTKTYAIILLIFIAVVMVFSVPGVFQGIMSPKGQFTGPTDSTISNGTEHYIRSTNVESGTYNYYIKCRDGGNNTNVADILLSVGVDMTTQVAVATPITAPASVSSGSGGDGGSGSGGSSPVDYSLTSLDLLQAGKEKVIYTKAETGIKEIHITTNKNVEDAQVTAKSLLSANVPKLDNTYKYLELTKTIDNNDISSLVLIIAVEKSWISKSNINENKIYLNRYANTWAKYDTMMVDQDDQYYYYKASIPGFSVFAITGDKLSTGSYIAPSQDAVDEIVQPVSVPAVQEETKSPVVSQPSAIGIDMIAIVAVVVAVVVLIIVFIIRRRHRIL